MATNRLLKIVFSLIGLGVATHSVAFNGFGTDIDGYIKNASNRYQVDEAMLRGLVKIEDGWCCGSRILRNVTAKSENFKI